MNLRRSLCHLGLMGVVAIGLGTIAYATDRYVDDSAPANGNGTPQYPFQTIQDAVDVAQVDDSIFVGQGTYSPANQESSIWLDSEVRIKGGYVGYNGLGFNTTRDTNLYPTTLSGDLSNNDIVGDFDTNRSDNALTVVRVPADCAKPSGTGANGANLDGCYIISGHNDREIPSVLPAPFELGGGMYIEPGTDTQPVIRACKFGANYSKMGGAVFTEQGSAATFRNCAFGGNRGGKGGAIAVYAGDEQGQPQNTQIDLLDCKFLGNESTAEGGAVYGSGYFGDGNAILNVICCTFDTNVCGEDIDKASAGGAIAMEGNSGTLTVVNTKFVDNVALAEEATGGAIYFAPSDGSFNIKNATFSGNEANIGGAVYVDTDSTDMFIVNSILWADIADTDDEIHIATGSESPTVDYSDVMGTWSGPGGNNIDDQPHLDSELRLASDSVCKDAGDNASVADDDFDVDEDTVTTGEDAPDRDLLTRIVDDVVDMGCYEYCPLCP